MKITADVFNESNDKLGSVEIDVSESYRSIYQEDYVALFLDDAFQMYQYIIKKLANKAIVMFGRNIFTYIDCIQNDEGVSLAKSKRYIDKYLVD